MRRRRRRKRTLAPLRDMPPGLDVGAYSSGIMPNQLPTFGPASVQPEKRLLLAVLEEAVRSWNRTAPGGPGAGNRRWRELVDWFASDDTSWPCAFASICETLGIDRGWAREHLGVTRAIHMIAVTGREADGPGPSFAKAS
jgi:hypothetical protein